MNVLSVPFIGITVFSFVLVWLAGVGNRKWTVMLCSILFISLLKPSKLDLAYLCFMYVFVLIMGRLISGNGKLVWLGAAVPAAGLCFFKYAGYFSAWNRAMPLGLSFFTFKAISYLADVYREKAKPADPVLLFDYLYFFPTYQAGPINRAEPFFRQMEAPAEFSYADQKHGCVQAAAGIFEKIVIADFLANMCSRFLNPELTGMYTVFGMILYTFQIYVDFDAYSNVAVGVARMLGIHLDRNFHTPYMAQNIRDFWRRWHISLSSWLRDYIYIPLGGSRKGTIRKWLNTLAIFLVSGLWHGSTLMFVFWGLGHGLVSVIEDMIRHGRKDTDNPFLRAAGILVNFVIVMLLWVFFRSASMTEALQVFRHMAVAMRQPALHWYDAGLTLNEWRWLWILLAMTVGSDIMRNRLDMTDWLGSRKAWVRWGIYFAMMVIAIVFGIYGPGYDPQNFIYITF